MVFDSSASSSMGMNFGLDSLLSGIFSSLMTFSSNFLMTSPLSVSSFFSYWHILVSFLIVLLCYLSIFSFSSNCFCSLPTLSFSSSSIFLFLEVTSFSSYNSLNKNSFSAFNSSFFFFSQVCSISRVSSSFIFCMGLIRDSVRRLLMKGFYLMLEFIWGPGSILIIEQYSLVFFLLASSRKISLYSWEESEFLSMS